jgi:ADP-ribose pyrophosphatase
MTNPSHLDDQHLIETCISSELVLEGGMMRVKRDQVRLPSGNQSQREFILHPGAVLIVPLLDNGNLLLERQFRYPLNRVFVELPAGKIDAGEDIHLTGQRELLEETGYVAQEWVYLGLQHPCIGYSDEVIYMFIAKGLNAGEAHCDEDEALELFEASLDDCMQMIATQQITDAKTILALMYLEKHLQGIWPALTLNQFSEV